MRDHCEKGTTTRSGRATAPAPRRIMVVARFIGSLCVLVALSTRPSDAAPLTADQFNSLAHVCAKDVSVDVLRSVASKESLFEPFALHNNTKKLTRIADDAKSATILAEQWIRAGDSVDIGLMQINAPNLAPLGITVAQAFDPCLSLKAAAAVLRTAYSRGASAAEQEAALLIMLSRYNTGQPLNGLVNGYVADVIAQKPDAKPIPTSPNAAAGPAAVAVPVWDVWANAAYAQNHGADWLVDLSPSPSTTTGSMGTTIRKSQ